MISKEEIFCHERKIKVEALVETKKKGKEQLKTPISCTKMLECARTTFCRFVNPLTTRNPLVQADEKEEVSA
ncbi:MAG: hypothetical protein JXR97_07145 [Planctomycetes bacterium]|nr:hypothetical protein [Planctomycetota bacterium]